ncbi:hypothetical protein REJC140_00535 [Pseudorhizobium endolithicum]|uniref:Uncharacterized protein n=1 Tax=Pseudorhizobium endolithicum TaxID=1191678 RepID=A0ABN7JG00_9HYPH|nr:hypothetical protein REJC140_00535 [Pseudorhizobium endolithicum]
MEARDVDDLVEAAAGRLQDCRQIGKGALDLLFEIRLRVSVLAAANLAGDEQEIAGPDRGGVAVRFVEGMAIGGEDCVAF